MNFDRILTELWCEKFEWFDPSPIEPFNLGREWGPSRQGERPLRVQLQQLHRHGHPVAESGRPGRAELLAKKVRTVGCVGCRPNWRTSGNVGEASDPFERRAHGRVPVAFWKNPENCWLNLAKIQQNWKFWQKLIFEILENNSKSFSNFQRKFWD